MALGTRPAVARARGGARVVAGAPPAAEPRPAGSTSPTRPRSSAAILGAMAYGTASSALAQVVTPRRLARLRAAAGAASRWSWSRAGAPTRARSCSRSPTSASCSARRCRAARLAVAAAGSPRWRPARWSARSLAGALSSGSAGDGRGIADGSRGASWPGSPARLLGVARGLGGRAIGALGARARLAIWPALVAVAARARVAAPARRRDRRALVGAVGLGAPAATGRPTGAWAGSAPASRCSPRPRAHRAPRAPATARPSATCSAPMRVRRRALLVTLPRRSARQAFRGRGRDLGRRRAEGSRACATRGRSAARASPPSLARRGDRAAHARTRRRGRRPRGRGRRARAHERRPRRERRRRDAAVYLGASRMLLVTPRRARPPGSAAPAPPPPPRRVVAAHAVLPSSSSWRQSGSPGRSARSRAVWG